METILTGILIPLFGTVCGAAAAVRMRTKRSRTKQRVLTGFAAGVMIASSIWNLILPAMKMSDPRTVSPLFPAVPGYWLGILCMLGIDRTVPHLHLCTEKPEGRKSPLSKTTMRVLSAAIHNFPEGMAIGAVLAASLCGALTKSAALALVAGIAIQNVPEGAILSAHLAEAGNSKRRSCMLGVLSGVAEPLAAVLTLRIANMAGQVLPLLLSAAAGAMMYVVAEELIPVMNGGDHSDTGTIAFAAGFSWMLAVDLVFA